MLSASLSRRSTLLQRPQQQQQEHQQQQQHQQYLRRQRQHFTRHSLQLHCVALLLLLILLQQVDVHSCRYVAASKRLHELDETETAAAASTVAGYANGASAAGEVVDKRTFTGPAGQPEEIFSLSDRLQSNYDEYPMVVPKRAALLLDRLMVALHHALEKERHRIGDFYGNKSGGFKPTKDGKLITSGTVIDSQGDEEPEQSSTHYNMYSDDDPSVVMDYDFKDLNSINRATGETLIAKSFQRRANMGDIIGGDGNGDGEPGVGLNDGMAMLTSSSALASAAAATSASSASANGAGGGGGGSIGGGGGGVARNNIGRMYWRCYFNAVSCF